eukprot:TRINITY_DN3636_c0_g2_i7.p1 TRINITY_DN3636_c0_g2~~TRINITY_DN3636_c0_g2_i7.p1  ORF type:complete len:380 (-),score=93.73 TRINITY_DN3636_c0_g2_i7:570-1709(-)
MQVEKVYYISKVSVKAANRKFSRSEYEMSLGKNSTVEEAKESDTKGIPKMKYSFVKSIADLQNMPVNNLVDVVGVIAEISPTSTFTSKKDGKELIKKSVHIVDNSKRLIELSLWGQSAENFSANVGNTIALKNARLGEYMSTKNLGSIASTQIDINPDIDAARQLAKWYEKDYQLTARGLDPLDEKGSSSVCSFSDIESAVEKAAMSGNNKPIYKKIKATLCWIKHDEAAPLFYKAAPIPSNHKVVENPNKTGKPWYCQKLNKYFDTYTPRFVLSVIFSDSTGSQWVNVFDEQAKLLLDADAKTVEELKKSGNQVAIRRLFEKPLYQRMWLKIKAHDDHYQDEAKIRCTVCSVEPIDHVKESRRILSSIFTLDPSLSAK